MKNQTPAVIVPTDPSSHRLRDNGAQAWRNAPWAAKEAPARRVKAVWRVSAISPGAVGAGTEEAR